MKEIITNKRVIFGENSIDLLAGLLKEKVCKKVFISIYSSNAPVLNRITKSLESEDIGYYIYDKIVSEPDLTVVNEGKRRFIEENCDCMLGIGGGSVIDTAKAIAMLSANGGLIEEYQMDGKPVTKLSPLFIAVPTTSGTGAEAAKVSVIYNNKHGLKKSVYHPNMIADIVILDPVLTAGLPKKLTASTGMDALSHAVESYVSLNANAITEMYSLRAIELINRSLLTAVNKGADLNAREDMALGSYLAGCALNAGIGIAHIVAQPLGAMFKIPHGDACSIFLPLSMELNIDFCTYKYKKIADILGLKTEGLDDKTSAIRAIEKIKEIRAQVGSPVSLNSYVGNKAFTMGEVLDNIRRSTGHIKCNPRPVDEKLMTRIIEMAIV
jgi:alcohol dehydrogenase class IV